MPSIRSRVDARGMVRIVLPWSVALIAFVRRLSFVPEPDRVWPPPPADISCCRPSPTVGLGRSDTSTYTYYGQSSANPVVPPIGLLGRLVRVKKMGVLSVNARALISVVEIKILHAVFEFYGIPVIDDDTAYRSDGRAQRRWPKINVIKYATTENHRTRSRMTYVLFDKPLPSSNEIGDAS